MFTSAFGMRSVRSGTGGQNTCSASATNFFFQNLDLIRVHAIELRSAMMGHKTEYALLESRANATLALKTGEWFLPFPLCHLLPLLHLDSGRGKRTKGRST